MDKQPTNQIKIKINGDERPFKEEVAIHKWNSSEAEAAAASENAASDDQFDWVLPEVEENSIPEFKKIYYEPTVEKPKSNKKFRKNSSSHLLTIIVSAATAISIGVLFGFIMLKVIAYQSEGVSQKSLGNEQNSISAGGQAQQNKSVSIPAFTTSLIQGGVYDDATTPANEIKAKGLPTTIITLEGKQYIFIGVSNNLETAKQLAIEQKKKNVDVYAKQLTFQGKKVDVTSNDEQTFLERTSALFQMMAEETSNTYVTGTLDNDGLSKIDKQYKPLQGLKDIKNNAIKNLLSAQSDCYQHLLNYQKNNDQNEIISAEQALLSYLKEFNEM